MSDTMITGFFLVMGLCSITALVSEWQTGVVIYRRGNIDVRDLPGLFYFRVTVQIAFIILSCAVVLHAFGLMGDPFVWMRQYTPFLMPRSR